MCRRPFAGLPAELNTLVPSRFLAATPFETLPHLPRYLQALLVRAERAALNPLKDAEKAQRVAPYAATLRELAAAASRSTAARAAWHRLRWLVEEYKVSVFAPELGTAEKVAPTAAGGGGGGAAAGGQLTAEGRIRPPRREACGVRALQRRFGCARVLTKSAGEPAQSKRLARSSPNLRRVLRSGQVVIRFGSGQPPLPQDTHQGRQRALPEPVHLEPESGKRGTRVTAPGVRRDGPIDAILLALIELGLAPLRVNQPVFRHSTLFVLEELLAPIHRPTARADDLDDQITRALEKQRVQPSQIGLGHEEDVRRSSGQVGAGLHLEGVRQRPCPGRLPRRKALRALSRNKPTSECSRETGLMLTTFPLTHSTCALSPGQWRKS